MSSLSSDEVPAMKKREAYLRYTILVSAMKPSQHGNPMRICVGQPRAAKGQRTPTLIFEKVAHPRPSSQDEL